jgi:hypothetical protein
MERVLVLTQDASWQERLTAIAPAYGATLSICPAVMGQQLQDCLVGVDWVVADMALLPPPESPQINVVHHILLKNHVTVVYSPGNTISLQDVRKSFIVGAVQMVEKPYTDAEIVRFFEHLLPSPGLSGGRRQWSLHLATQL